MNGANLSIDISITSFHSTGGLNVSLTKALGCCCFFLLLEIASRFRLFPFSFADTIQKLVCTKISFYRSVSITWRDILFRVCVHWCVCGSVYFCDVIRICVIHVITIKTPRQFILVKWMRAKHRIKKNRVEWNEIKGILCNTETKISIHTIHILKH